MADEIKRLAARDDLYAEYFWWKPFYNLKTATGAETLCDLCRKLHDPNEPPKVYPNMQKWWVNEAKCSKWAGGKIVPARPWVM